jgi:hypothetical protein
MTDLVHGSNNVFSGNDARSIRVKLVEQGTQLIIIQEIIQVNGGYNEFRVVDLVVAKVVYLVDNCLNILFADLDVLIA